MILIITDKNYYDDGGNDNRDYEVNVDTAGGIL